jgi:hypothetical protein
MMRFCVFLLGVHTCELLAHRQVKRRRAACRTNRECSASTPICRQGECTDQRIIEDLSTLPERDRPHPNEIKGPYTKWLRSVLPIFGTEYTKPAAMMEVAYFIENMLVNQSNGNLLGHPELANMVNSRRTRVFVQGPCPSGGGAGANSIATYLSEGWVLQYDKICEATYGKGFRCEDVRPGDLCNNCGARDPCNQTMAHEFGHTIWEYVKEKVPGFAERCLRHFNVRADDPLAGEWLAWTTQNYAMHIHNNRDAMEQLMMFPPYNTPGRWRYRTKNYRCPSTPREEACEDSRTRRFKVASDSW